MGRPGHEMAPNPVHRIGDPGSGDRGRMRGRGPGTSAGIDGVSGATQVGFESVISRAYNFARDWTITPWLSRARGGEGRGRCAGALPQGRAGGSRESIPSKVEESVGWGWRGLGDSNREEGAGEVAEEDRAAGAVELDGEDGVDGRDDAQDQEGVQNCEPESGLAVDIVIGGRGTEATG